MTTDLSKKVGNDFTGATSQGKGASASGRGGDKRLILFGHVERMEREGLPIAALHGHVEGRRSRGRQRKI